MESAARDEGFCLDDLDGQYQLNRNHTYYYQVNDTTIQYYIIITKNIHTLLRFKRSCFVLALNTDSIVYTEKDIHVEQIAVDSQFMDNILPKAKSLLENSILPELLGRWFSRPPDGSTS